MWMWSAWRKYTIIYLDTLIGCRTQEGELTDSQQIKHDIKRIINEGEDSVRLYIFRTKDQLKTEIIGVEKRPISTIIWVNLLNWNLRISNLHIFTARFQHFQNVWTLSQENWILKMHNNKIQSSATFIYGEHDHRFEKRHRWGRKEIPDIRGNEKYQRLLNTDYGRIERMLRLMHVM